MNHKIHLYSQIKHIPLQQQTKQSQNNMSNVLSTPHLNPLELDQLMFYDTFDDDENRRRRNATIITAMYLSKSSYVTGRNPNRATTRHEQVTEMILRVKLLDPRFFTRMFRLTPSCFDRLVDILSPRLLPSHHGGKNIISPLILVCLTLRIVAGGSYLDLSLLYDVPRNVIHQLVWKVVALIAKSDDPFLDNIHFPINDYNKLRELEEGFAALTKYRIRGTVAAGDGIVIEMVAPTNEEVDNNVKSYFTRKNCFALGLQVRI